jgi:hypothetical protein
MLIAERKAQVYGRTDGGDGAMLAADGNVLKSHNAPPEDLPKRWWNLALVSMNLLFAMSNAHYSLTCSLYTAHRHACHLYLLPSCMDWSGP